VRNPRIVPWVLCVLFVFACALPAPAALLYDGFDYASGVALSGQTNNNVQPPLTWAYVGTGASSADPKTTTGSLTYPGLPASVGNSILTDRTQTGVSRIALPSAQTTGTVYYSMILKVNDVTNLTNTTTGSFLAGLNNVTGAGLSIAAAGASLMIHRDAVDTAGYNLGVAVSTANADRFFDAVDHTAAQTLFIVSAYQFGPAADDDNAYLWINPAAATFGTNNIPAPDVTSSGAVSVGTASDIPTNQLTSVFLRNNGVEPNQIQVDELRVDTTWAGVTGAVPEPGAATLIFAGAHGIARPSPPRPPPGGADILVCLSLVFCLWRADDWLSRTD